MKRIITVFISISLAFSLAGCSLDSDSGCEPFEAYSLELWTANVSTGVSTLIFENWPLVTEPVDWDITAVSENEQRIYVALGGSAGHGVVFPLENRDALMPIEANGKPASLSIDESFFAYNRNTESAQIRVSTAFGENDRSLFEDFPVTESRNPYWLEDSRRLFFQGIVDGQEGLFIFDKDNDAFTFISEATPDWREAAISPNGEAAAYIDANSTGPGPLFVKNILTGEETQIADEAKKPVFISPAGHRVIFKEGNQLKFYRLQDEETGTISNIAVGNSISMSPDGSRLVYFTPQGLKVWNFTSNGESTLADMETLDRVREGWDEIDSRVISTKFHQGGSRVYFLVNRFNAREC